MTRRLCRARHLAISTRLRSVAVNIDASGSIRLFFVRRVKANCEGVLAAQRA